MLEKRTKGFSPEFQTNGPYREYTERHLQLKREQNTYLLLILVPSSLYFVTQKGIFLTIGLVYLACVLLLLRRSRNRLFEEYSRMEQETFSRLQDHLEAFCQEQDAAAGRPAASLNDQDYAFGYEQAQGGFHPVLLLRHRGNLYIFKNVFAKNVIYGFQQQLLYLFDLKAEALTEPPRCVPLDKITWTPCPKTHQELLREEGLQQNDLFVMESFLYGDALEQMKRGKRKDMTHVEAALTGIRKEKIYEGRAASQDGSCPWQLFVTEMVATQLELIENDHKKSQKGTLWLEKH